MAGRHHTGSETGCRFREIFSFLKIRSDGRVPGVVYGDSINGGPAVSGSDGSPCDYCMFKKYYVSCSLPHVYRNILSSTAILTRCVGTHPCAGAARPLHLRFVPTSLPSPSLSGLVILTPLGSCCTCLLLLEKPSRRAAGGCACSSMRDANRPTPRS